MSYGEGEAMDVRDMDLAQCDWCGDPAEPGERYCGDVCEDMGEWDRVDPMDPMYDDIMDREMFADPGGNSALRAAGPDNPRNLPCPTCGEPGRLTPADRERGYQCDSCADAAERGY